MAFAVKEDDDDAVYCAATASAFSAAVVAQEESGRLKGGMFSWPFAFVSTESLSFHHPREDEGSR